MKKLIGCPLAWLLWAIGHCTYLPTNWGKFDGRWQNWYGERSYWLYNWAMLKSSAVQDWAYPGAGDSFWWRWWPWGKNYVG